MKDTSDDTPKIINIRDRSAYQPPEAAEAGEDEVLVPETVVMSLEEVRAQMEDKALEGFVIVGWSNLDNDFVRWVCLPGDQPSNKDLYRYAAGLDTIRQEMLDSTMGEIEIEYEGEY